MGREGRGTSSVLSIKHDEYMPERTLCFFSTRYDCHERGTWRSRYSVRTQRNMWRRWALEHTRICAAGNKRLYAIAARTRWLRLENELLYKRRYRRPLQSSHSFQTTMYSPSFFSCLMTSVNLKPPCRRTICMPCPLGDGGFAFHTFSKSSRQD